MIRCARRSRGLSQEQVAAIAGVAQPNLSAYENDRRLPSVDTLNRLLVACGYQLAAHDGGNGVIYCPLPGGFFSDDDDPPPLPDDPPDEEPTVTADTPLAERERVIMAVLDLVDAVRERKGAAR
jgi:transcriptional regulator with XRE-family HTH domain